MRSYRVRSTSVPIRILWIHAKEESQLEGAKNVSYLSLLAMLTKPIDTLPRGCQVGASDAPKRPHLGRVVIYNKEAGIFSFVIVADTRRGCTVCRPLYPSTGFHWRAPALSQCVSSGVVGYIRGEMRRQSLGKNNASSEDVGGSDTDGDH